MDFLLYSKERVCTRSSKPHTHIHASAGPALPVQPCPDAKFYILTDEPFPLYRRAVGADAQFPRAHIRPGDY